MTRDRVRGLLDYQGTAGGMEHGRAHGYRKGKEASLGRQPASRARAGKTLIVGVDCAAQERNTGLAAAWYDGRTIRLIEARPASRGHGVRPRMLSWIAGQPVVLLGMDAPLGWPEAMGRELRLHAAGRPINTLPNDLFRRLTDHVTRTNVGKTPMDVGADRIARAAYAALRLIGDLQRELGARISLAWQPRLSPGVWAIEVYPAGFLKANGIQASGYKEPGSGDQRRAMLQELRAGYPFEEPPGQDCTVDQHLFDAVLCIFAAADFLRGRAIAPAAGQEARAHKEGWIWIRGGRHA